MGLFFELQQHNVPQKITFFMKIYDFENESIVQSEKLEKKSILLFSPLSRTLIMFYKQRFISNGTLNRLKFLKN